MAPFKWTGHVVLVAHPKAKYQNPNILNQLFTQLLCRVPPKGAPVIAR
jgi:hypothetical protein